VVDARRASALCVSVWWGASARAVASSAPRLRIVWKTVDAMASCWGACFGRSQGGGGGDVAAAAPSAPRASDTAGQSPSVANLNGARPAAAVVPNLPAVPSLPLPAAGVDAAGDAKGEICPSALAGSDPSSSLANVLGPRFTDGEHPRPSAASADHVDSGGSATGGAVAAEGAAQGHTSWGDHARVDGGGGGTLEHTACGDGEGSGGAEAARGRGYPIVTFLVRSCEPDMPAVARGTKVHACLGRNVYVLWRTPRRGVPASEDDFRRAGPTRIRLERGGVGALRSATASEAAAAGVPHTDCLLFLHGTQFSSGGGGQALCVTLVLEAPSAAECKAWEEAGDSLLTPLDELLGAGPGDDGGTARVQALVQEVLPPLSAATSGLPNVVFRMLGRRGRRFVLNAHHWLTPATPGAFAGASVIRKAGDAVDQVAPVPLVGPALRLGLLVVQVGALAVLADGHDARREDAVGLCEGVAYDLLDRVFTELRGGLTEFGRAYSRYAAIMVVQKRVHKMCMSFFSLNVDLPA